MSNIDDDHGAERRKIYIDYMKASNQQLRNKGITQDLNEISLKQWRSQTWPQRIKYLQELQIDKKQNKIISYFKPKNSKQLKMQKQKDGLRLLFQQEEDNQNKQSLLNLHKQNQNEPLFLNENKEFGSTLKQQNQNQEYIEYYKYQFQEIKTKNPMLNSLEITKIVKDKWKQLKKIKMQYSQAIEKSTPQKHPNQSIQDIQVKGVQPEIEPNTKLALDLNEVEFFFMLDNQTQFQITGSLLLDASRIQGSKNVFIEVNQLFHSQSRADNSKNLEQKSIISDTSDEEDNIESQQSKKIHSEDLNEVHSYITIDDSNKNMENSEGEYHENNGIGNLFNPLKQLLNQKVMKNIQ